jgi:hypothetical protein
MVGFQYLLFALLIGVLVDALGGWFVPLLLFYFVGLTIGLSGTFRGRGMPALRERGRAQCMDESGCPGPYENPLSPSVLRHPLHDGGDALV